MGPAVRSLKGKTVLLTGAAGGIGALVATRLALREGASLILADKNFDRLAELQSAIEQKSAGPARISIHEVDLSSTASMLDFHRKIGDRSIDVLINNAGVVYSGPFENMKYADFEYVLAVNLRAAVFLTGLLLPVLKKNRGHIVNVASGAGLVAPAGLNAYATSKFALVGFSEALRAELRGRVGVSAVCPAFVATSIMKNSLLDPEIAGRDREVHIEKVDSYLRRIGINPKRVSDRIVSSIKRNRGMVPVGTLTHLIWNQKKLFPGLTGFLNAVIFRYVMKKGMLK